MKTCIIFTLIWNIYMHIPKWYIPSYNNSSREGMLNGALDLKHNLFLDDVQGLIKLILLNIKINRNSFYQNETIFRW